MLLILAAKDFAANYSVSIHNLQLAIPLDETAVLEKLLIHIKFGQLGKILPEVAQDKRIKKIPGVMQKLIDAFVLICFPDFVDDGLYMTSHVTQNRRRFNASNPDRDGAFYISKRVLFDKQKNSYTKQNQDDHVPIVGHKIEKDVSTWTFLVTHLGPSKWYFAFSCKNHSIMYNVYNRVYFGVIANSAPINTSYSDMTSYGWSGSCQWYY